MSQSHPLYGNEEALLHLTRLSYEFQMEQAKVRIFYLINKKRTERFVDFNNQAWPRKRGSDSKKYFVVGSSQQENLHIDFNFYDIGEKTAKCSRFINWPDCNKPGLEQACEKRITHFFQKQAHTHHNEPQYQTIFLLLHFPSREDHSTFVEEFSYIKTTDTGNTVYRSHKRHVSLSNQAWLSSRIKSFVVFAPSRDGITSMERVSTLLPSHPPFYIIPRDSLDECTSVSYCAPGWALTASSPGAINYCSGLNFLYSLTKVESTVTQQPCTMGDTNVRTRSCSPSQDNRQSVMPAMESIDLSDTEETYTRDETTAKSKHCCIQVKDLENTISVLHAQHESMQQELQLIWEDLLAKNSLIDEALNLVGDNEKRRFGLYRSREDLASLKRELRHMTIDGRSPSTRQINTIAAYPWLSYYRNSSEPEGDFIRCRLCNAGAETDKYDPEEDHSNCATTHHERGKVKKNLLGRGSVMCIQRFHGHESSKKTGIDLLIARLKSHEASVEHAYQEKEFVSSMTAVQSSGFRDVEATMSSTLTAYTIAKEGLAFMKQFPLLLLCLRSGTTPTTAHYDSSSAKKMIDTFAEHMKYDVLKYVIGNDLPFSLLADGSSNDGVKWIVFLIRTVSPMNRPITFHLALVEVVSERADDIVNALTSTLGGTSSMGGDSWSERNTLQLLHEPNGSIVFRWCLRYERRTREDFLLSICAAHRLNLAVKAQDNVAFNLTIAVVIEMHHLFGSTLGTRGRAYDGQRVCRILCRRFSVYTPSSFHALGRLATDTSASPNIKQRAEAAAFALEDGRTFIILHHVNATLSHFAKFSEALQDDEALLIDFLSRWKHFDSLLSHNSIKEAVYDYLAHSGLLLMADAHQSKYENADTMFLKNYYPSQSHLYYNGINYYHMSILAFNPRKFPDFSAEKVQRRSAQDDPLSEQSFRDLAIPHSQSDKHFHKNELQSVWKDPTISDAFILGRVYRQMATTDQAIVHIDRFYADIRAKFRRYMYLSRLPTEPLFEFPYALDRHIILDIIECNGNTMHSTNVICQLFVQQIEATLLYGRGWECGQASSQGRNPIINVFLAKILSLNRNALYLRNSNTFPQLL
ncbi:hypothetical protein COOONC_04770 [Cooperia oncophora]